MVIFEEYEVKKVKNEIPGTFFFLLNITYFLPPYYAALEDVH